MSEQDEHEAQIGKQRDQLDFYRTAYITAMFDAGWDIERITAAKETVDAFITFLNTGELTEE